MFDVFALFALINMSWSFNIGQERDPFVYSLKGLTKKYQVSLDTI